MNESKHYVQVEIPKLPRWLADLLNKCQTRGYLSFKLNVTNAMNDLDYTKEKFDWVSEYPKDFDLAIALGVWEIDE